MKARLPLRTTFHKRVDAYPLIFLTQDKTKPIYHIQAEQRAIKNHIINCRIEPVSENLTREQLDVLKPELNNYISAVLTYDTLPTTSNTDKYKKA